MRNEPACRVIDFRDYPGLREKLEDATGILLWVRLVHFGREDQPCWLTVGAKEIMLPGLWYMGSILPLSHYLPMAHLDKSALRAAYQDLLRIIKEGGAA